MMVSFVFYIHLILTIEKWRIDKVEQQLNLSTPIQTRSFEAHAHKTVQHGNK